MTFFTLVTVSVLVMILARLQHNKNLKAYNKCFDILTYDEIEDAVSGAIGAYSDTEKVYTYVYKGSEIPLGRVSAFLNYHKSSVFDDDPYLYLCKRSLKDNEFREYGCVVTRRGIFYSIDNPGNASRKEKENALPGREKHYFFTGLANVRICGPFIILDYIRPGKAFDSVKIISISDKNERNLIYGILKSIVAENIGFSLHKGCVVATSDDIPEMVNRIFGNPQNAYAYYHRQVEKTEKYLHQKGFNIGVGAAGVQAASPQFNAYYAENKNYMNGAKGHGYAAEYGNNAVDRFLFREVENAAQNLVNGHQAKNGADRIVNGVEIQTKYYQSASETIGAVFENNQAKYIRSDGSQKMMAIEVPRDQYHQALEIMQKRIDDGQVPNVEPGENARDYVRKGYFTYEQSFKIAQSGTIESLAVDAMSGAVCCSQAAGISAIIVFAVAVWSGQSVENALKQSLGVGLKVLGTGTLVYTMTMQLSRESFANLFAGKNIVNGVSRGFYTVNNPIFTLSENLATQIKSSALANGTIAKSLGLDTISGKQIVGGAVTAVVVFGPDIARALSGRISTKQLVKNATIGVAGIAGGALGQIFIPIPVVGPMIGGAISSFAAKKTMDRFIEDDAKEMFRILKEEFLDTTMLAGLSKEELEEVVTLTVGSKRISKELQKMYQSKNYRYYARESIMNTAIQDVISKRNYISENSYNGELIRLAEATA